MLFEDFTTFQIIQEHIIINMVFSSACLHHVIDNQMWKTWYFQCMSFQIPLHIYTYPLILITWAASAELTPIPKIFFSLILPAYSILPWLHVLCYQYTLK